MVLRKRLDYRVNGYHFPSFPLVPIYAKGKRSVRKKNVEECVYAFDLLAAVERKLLERETSSATCDVPGSSISDLKQEIFNEEKPCNDEFLIQDNHPKVSTVTSSSFILGQDNSSWKKHSETLELSGSSLVSLCSNSSNKNVMGERGSSVSGKLGICKNISGNGKTSHSLEPQAYETVIDGNPLGSYNLDDPVESDVKPPLIKSESSMEVHISGDNDPYSSSFPHSGDGLELPVLIDDDENFSWCTHPCTTTNKASKPHLGEHRLRRLLARRNGKVDLGASKLAELSKTAFVDLKTPYQSRKISYTRQRTRRISLKRRKLFNRYSLSASRKGFGRAGVLNLFNKNEILEGTCSSPAWHGVNRISHTITKKLSPHKSEDFHVKLSINSFIVPELFIEIPETATVGCLKRTVIDAITTIIASGLHVGVLLQGKNVRDDDRTLIQAGISNANELDELSFTLEPNSSLPCRYSKPEKPHLFLPCESTEPLTRYITREELRRAMRQYGMGDDEATITELSPCIYHTINLRPTAGTCLDHGKNASSSYHASSSTIICHESDPDSVHPLLNPPSLDKAASFQTLTACPAATSVETLSVAPVHKPSLPELVQRRIRRPFTVYEVEALVQAVEKLGTGRWRDVKIRSFNSAKHRTYVDLKDKWKTLVHTARISPQQRRGELVPQELLDRVLRAHAYWSQQQANTPSAEVCMGL